MKILLDEEEASIFGYKEITVNLEGLQYSNKMIDVAPGMKKMACEIHITGQDFRVS